ncbi:unnamed protein product [Caenorhabditis bovis]|uniref:Uncharacterized protein n=1 Tax=Caenorhabditis bovis TaxID=2654633 RepID=A0A8S1F746_9PELO|nr:unnamed protein product [Caenorhabditis bovis]
MNLLAVFLGVLCFLATFGEAIEVRRIKSHRTISGKPANFLQRSLPCKYQADCPFETICDNNYCLTLDELFKKYDEH